MLCAEEEPRFQRTRMHCEKLMFSEAAQSSLPVATSKNSSGVTNSTGISNSRKYDLCFLNPFCCVKWGLQAYTTPTVFDICRIAVFF